MRPPLGQLLQRFLLLCLGFGLGLGLLELILRMVVWWPPSATPATQLARAAQTLPPPQGNRPCQPADEQPFGALVQPSTNPAIVYELKPNLDTCSWGGHHVRTNNVGMRAKREYRLAKPPGTFRIVGLGDSLMLGLGVDDDDIYSRKIEQQLTAQWRRPVEFINLAVPGYNTAIEAEVLRTKGLTYQPDVLVLHWCGNDAGVPFFLQSDVTASSWRLQALLNAIMDRWSPLRAWRRRVIASTHHLAIQPLEQIDTPDLRHIPAPYHWMVGRTGVLRALDRIQHLAAGPPSIPIVVLVHTFYTPVMSEAELREAFNARGFRVCHVAHPPEHWLRPTDHHLNTRGHAFHADQLIAILDAQHLLPDPVSTER